MKQRTRDAIERLTAQLVARTLDSGVGDLCSEEATATLQAIALGGLALSVDRIEDHINDIGRHVVGQ